MSEEKTNPGKFVRRSAKGTIQAGGEAGFEGEVQQLRASAEANLVNHAVSAAKAGMSAAEIKKEISAGVAEADSTEGKGQ